MNLTDTQCDKVLEKCKVDLVKEKCGFVFLGNFVIGRAGRRYCFKSNCQQTNNNFVVGSVVWKRGQSSVFIVIVI